MGLDAGNPSATAFMPDSVTHSKGKGQFPLRSRTLRLDKMCGEGRVIEGESIRLG